MTTPAGWYPDPTNEGQQRYWDGERWTDYMAPLAGDPAASGAAATDATAGASTDATATWSAPATPGDTADPAAAAAPGRSRGKLAGGIAAGVLVVAAGAFAATQLAGADGGADSPEGAVTALFEALGDEDVVGMAEVVLPGERRTYVDPMLEGVGHLQRWGVLDESLDTSDVAGIDLEIEGLETRVDEVSDDIVNVYVDGAISASVDGEELPVGELLSDRALEGQDMSELDADEEPAEFSDVRITAVREDGRWYVSALYTVAEQAREEAGALPIHADDGVQPVGADSPEEAVDGMLDAMADLDLESMIARLNPDEAAALQRYAPLFLDEAQAEIDAMVDETGLEITVDDAAYDVDRRDGFAVVVPTSIAVSGTADGETMSFEVDGECTTFTVDGEAEEYCTEGSPDLDLTDTPVGDLEEIFSDMDPIGLVVVEHGGRWYVSPIRSYSEAILAVMRTIERDDVERLLDAIEDGSLEAWLEEEFETILEEAFGFSSFDEFAGATADFDEIEGGWSEYEPTGEIEALVDACGAGDMAACDDLYWSTPVGSDEEAFAETCGGTMPPESGGTCVERSGGGGEGSTTETTMSAAFTYGDDPTLDALWDACEAGDGAACDDLYSQAPYDSEYERFGQSCGNREPDDNLDWCEDLMAGAGG